MRRELAVCLAVGLLGGGLILLGSGRPWDTAALPIYRANPAKTAAHTYTGRGRP